MSDPCGTDDRSSFEPDSEPGGPPEPEDMNIFIHNILHNSPATVATAVTAGSSSLYRCSGSTISFNFWDRGDFFVGEAKEGVEKTYSLSAVGDCDAGLEASDTATNQAQMQSSIRSRSAEVHNLSEKTDEAIEYLKQLQLQVQMLTMRNGLGFHPNYVSGSLPPMQLPMNFNEDNVMANTSREAATLTTNQEVVMQTAFGISNPKVSSEQLVIPSITNNSSSAFSYGLESSMQNN